MQLGGVTLAVTKLTSGCALRIAMRLLRCGSSVYIHRKSCGSRSPLAAAAAGSGSSLRPETEDGTDGTDEMVGEGEELSLELGLALLRSRGSGSDERAVVVAIGAGVGWMGCGVASVRTRRVVDGGICAKGSSHAAMGVGSMRLLIFMSMSMSTLQDAR